VFVDFELLTDPIVDLLQVFDGSPVELLKFIERLVLFLFCFCFFEKFGLQSTHRCSKLKLTSLSLLIFFF
jgi:hypothetical protein